MPKSAKICEIDGARRNNPRVRLHIPAMVQFASGPIPCQLDDISQRGARISRIEPAERASRAGTICVLQVTGIEAFGKVVWSTKTRCGLLFDERMPLHDVVAVRHFNEQKAEAEAVQRSRMGRTVLRVLRSM